MNKDKEGGERMKIRAVNTGRRLKILRGSRTVQELANELGVSRQAVYAWEAGIRVPTDAMKRRIAKALGGTVEAIFYSGLENER